MFCFPYAGASASAFAPWQQYLGADIEVCALQLPGRGARFNEACVTQWPALIDQLTQVVAQYTDRPYAFFGHSLGGLIAFELARACAEQDLPAPVHLFVSATNPPQVQPARPDVTLIDDNALLERLKNYNGTPAEVLQDSELMSLILPILRADLTLLQNYVYRLKPKLSSPITALSGKDDSHVDYSQLGSWEQETLGGFRQHEFAGDHFYIQSQRTQVLNLLHQTLE